MKLSDQQRRWAFFLPNIFTCLNMACGFTAIMLAMKGNFFKASHFLLLGAVFDSVDGRVARLTGTQSSFGEQFDSLSDLLSFGVAPALLFYLCFLTETGRLGMIVTFLFILCGAMRLARFNANIAKISADYFQGIPIPMGAMALVGWTFFSTEFPFVKEYPKVSAAYIFIYAVLMISTFPFPAFKHSPWVQKHKRISLMLIFFVIATIWWYEPSIIIFITAYVLASFIYYLTHREKFIGIFDGSGEIDEDETSNNH